MQDSKEPDRSKGNGNDAAVKEGQGERAMKCAKWLQTALSTTKTYPLNQFVWLTSLVSLVLQKMRASLRSAQLFSASLDGTIAVFQLQPCGYDFETIAGERAKRASLLEGERILAMRARNGSRQKATSTAKLTHQFVWHFLRYSLRQPPEHHLQPKTELVTPLFGFRRWHNSGLVLEHFQRAESFALRQQGQVHFHRRGRNG